MLSFLGELGSPRLCGGWRRKGSPFPHSLALRRGGWPPQRPTPSVARRRRPAPRAAVLVLPVGHTHARCVVGEAAASLLPAERSPEPRRRRKGPPEAYCSLFERGLKTSSTPRANKGASDCWLTRPPTLLASDSS